MSARQSTQWFWSDWAGDQAVRRLTPAERGLWIDLIAIAAVAQPIGYVCDDRGNPLSLEEIGRFANCSATEVENLIDGILRKGVASRDRTGRLFNRRLVRTAELSVKKRRAGQLGGSATKLKWQGFNALPQHLPQHVPRHRESSLTLNSKRITASELGTAREGTQPVDDVDNPRKPTITASDGLAEVIAKKGWVR